MYKHFKDFCNGRCLMKDVTIGLCNDFRTYILKIRVKQTGNIISRNSAAGYWSTFRALLKLAYKEGWLRENVNTRVRDKNFMIFNQAKDIEYWAAFQGRLIYLYSLVLLIPEDKLPV